MGLPAFFSILLSTGGTLLSKPDIFPEQFEFLQCFGGSVYKTNIPNAHRDSNNIKYASFFPNLKEKSTKLLLGNATFFVILFRPQQSLVKEIEQTFKNCSQSVVCIVSAKLMLLPLVI